MNQESAGLASVTTELSLAVGGLLMWQLGQFSGRQSTVKGLFCFPPSSTFCLPRRWLFKRYYNLSLLWEETSVKVIEFNRKSFIYNEWV